MRIRTVEEKISKVHGYVPVLNVNEKVEICKGL